jgi:hypothetical protein
MTLALFGSSSFRFLRSCLRTNVLCKSAHNIFLSEQSAIQNNRRSFDGVFFVLLIRSKVQRFSRHPRVRNKPLLFASTEVFGWLVETEDPFRVARWNSLCPLSPAWSRRIAVHMFHCHLPTEISY